MPFSDGEFIKLLVLAIEPENILFCDMPLSNDTVQRRIQESCIFICNEIAQCVKKSPFFSLCLDEINDITKTAQIIVCVFVTSMWMKIYFVRDFCALLI
jgi:hypothetical protein